MRPKDLENTKRKEQLILDSARNCFLSKGFHKTTMRDIAKEASISLGNIYQYYQGKNDIILKFVELSNQETTQAIEYISNASNFKKALKQVLAMLLDEFVTKKELVIYLEILSEALKNPEIKSIIKQEKTETVFEQLFIQAEQDKKIHMKLCASSSVSLILTAVETAATNMLIHEKSYSKSKALNYINEVFDMVLS